MAVLHTYQKRGPMELWNIVRFQIMIHCHTEEISISEADLDCITLLAINGKVELTAFCNSACLDDEREIDEQLDIVKEILKTPQSVRNAISKLSLMGLVIKEGRSRKQISVSPSLKLQTSGNILVEIKYVRRDVPKES